MKRLFLAATLLGLVTAGCATVGPTLSQQKAGAREIHADIYWNDTGFLVERGQAYRFKAEGNWTDLVCETDWQGMDSCGWATTLGESLRRDPRSKWFQMVCTVNQDENTSFSPSDFQDKPWYATADGRLECFANDVWWMYGNNSGVIHLELVAGK